MWTINDFRPIYQEFLDSGKTVTQFCAEIGIRESRFYHWQKVLRQEAEDDWLLGPCKAQVRGSLGRE